MPIVGNPIIQDLNISYPSSGVGTYLTSLIIKPGTISFNQTVTQQYGTWLNKYKYRLEKDKLFVIISSNELTSNILKLINERENLINVPLGQKVDEIIYSSTLIIELNQYNYLKEVINNDINQLEFYLNMLKDNQRVIEYEPFVNAVKNIFDIFRTSKETLVLHTWYQKYYLNLHRLTNKELKDII